MEGGVLMWRRWLIYIVLFFSVIVIHAGCEEKPVKYQNTFIQALEDKPPEPDDTLLVWTTKDIFTGTTDYFFEHETTLKLKVEVINQAEVIDRFYEALTYKRPPDLFLLPDEFVGLFSEIDGFVDFNSYLNDHGIYHDLPRALMDRYVNLENKRYGVPVTFFPYVTYYRHDILDSFGFPSEPEALAQFIEKQGNYFTLAKVLSEDNLYIFESNQALVQLGLRTSYPFSSDYSYQYTAGSFLQVTEAVALLYLANLQPGISIWSDHGQWLLENDQLVMFQMPSYGADHLKQWVPEQKGNWRMTDLPFGLSGMDREGSLVALMSEKSHYKETAFALLQAMTRDQNYHIFHESSHPMLDQEHLTLYYNRLLSKEAEGRPSMLDLYARRHWHNTMFDINKGVPLTPLLFEKTHDRLQEEIKLDQRILIEQFVNGTQEN